MTSIDSAGLREGLELVDVLETELSGAIQGVCDAADAHAAGRTRATQLALDDALNTLRVLHGLVRTVRRDDARPRPLPFRAPASFAVLREDGEIALLRRPETGPDARTAAQSLIEPFSRRPWADPVVIRRHLDRAVREGQDTSVVRVNLDDGSTAPMTLRTVAVHQDGDVLLVMTGTWNPDGLALDVQSILDDARAVADDVAALAQHDVPDPAAVERLAVRAGVLAVRISGAADRPPDPAVMPHILRARSEVHRALGVVRELLGRWRDDHHAT